MVPQGCSHFNCYLQGQVAICVSYAYQFIIKYIIKDTDKQPNEEVQRVRSRGPPNEGISIPRELGCATHPHVGILSNVEAHQLLLFMSFYRASSIAPPFSFPEVGG